MNTAFPISLMGVTLLAAAAIAGQVSNPTNQTQPPTGARFRPPTLIEDEEALLYLTKHFDGDFYVMQGIQDVVKKPNANYEKDVAEAKKVAKLLADPMASLKSKDADERFQTAAMLIERYRT